MTSTSTILIFLAEILIFLANSEYKFNETVDKLFNNYSAKIYYSSKIKEKILYIFIIDEKFHKHFCQQPFCQQANIPLSNNLCRY